MPYVPNILDAQGRAVVGAGTAERWSVVVSGITVAPARVACTFPPGDASCWADCQGGHTYAPGGTPLGGTFEVTKDAWDELDALLPGRLPAPSTGYDAPDCRWAYFENPGTTMVGGLGGFDSPDDLSDADPPTIFAILFYRISGKFVGQITNFFLGEALPPPEPTGANSEVFDSFFSSDEATSNPDCDRNTIVCTNFFTACTGNLVTRTFRVGKFGSITATRCT